jgi:hypothetical protein
VTAPRFLLGVESLAPGNGGVCRVAGLMARAIHDSGWLARAVVLSDRQPPADVAVPARVLGGSRLAFARHVWQATPAASHVIYDLAGMARVHCRIPLPAPSPWQSDLAMFHFAFASIAYRASGLFS